jgi:alpha-1,3-rhamnosyl/mannosyltransferase
LFEAYSLLPENIQKKFKLVVCVGKGWNDSDIYESAKPLVDDEKLIFTGFVSDRDLAKLYEDAFLFVYPSLYEGFGFPVVEAMSFGLPVVTSDVSSMPEAAGDAGILVNPNSPKSISSAILRILEDELLRKKLSRQSLKQSQKFSWRTCARETLEVIENVTQGR